MPDAYEVHDAQFIQTLSTTSVADSLYVRVGPVPAGKIWTIVRAYSSASVAETRTVWFSVQERAALYIIPITRPISQAIAPALSQFFPLLTEGLECKLFPGEYLYAWRDAATAGSTMSVVLEFIETDLPFYREADKHKELRRKVSRPESLLRRAASTAARVGAVVRGGPTAPRGGSGVPY